MKMTWVGRALHLFFFFSFFFLFFVIFFERKFFLLFFFSFSFSFSFLSWWCDMCRVLCGVLERCAHQYRNEPPPELLLTFALHRHRSAFFRVATLMLLLKPLSRALSVAAAHIQAFTFIALQVEHPKNSQTCETPWSVIRDGSNDTMWSGISVKN